MKTGGVTCGACGTRLHEAAKFCHECGSAVTAADEPAEYKQVTVLFADVVHSMDIAATVGSERLREIMSVLVDRAARVVHRYGGTVDKFTGDGIMALFGAPKALEDHAIRACLSALNIQEQAQDLAAEVRRRDGIELQLRIGLNSGEVIAGQLGSSAFGYTAMGEQVGMAQRMESVAPPGGVMLSQSTARLVENNAVLDRLKFLDVKGRRDPLPARRLRAISVQGGQTCRSEVRLIGRQRQIRLLTTMLERAIAGSGGVVGIVGAAGIGKSRLVREAAAMASRRGAEVFSTFCQSHTSDIAFYGAAGLLRALFEIDGVKPETARERVRQRLFDANTEDWELLCDLLGIGESGMGPVAIDPDARRRRLAGVVQAAALTRSTPTVYVVEDAHWLDDVSELILADLVSALRRTHSLALLTYRPEYRGILTETTGSQAIRLAPLVDTEISALTKELLGIDPSVAGLYAEVAERSDGNPFFAEEIVRDLAEREVLIGTPGAYVCRVDTAQVSVPATVQATIEARIDRLSGASKRTLHAAAVIGSRFDANLLTRIDPAVGLTELVDAELVEPVIVSPREDYAFCHPLIRAVAYESQLRSDRIALHRRVAAAIELHDPTAVEENAALIATHLEAAGDLRAAFEWHMRAATWLTNRDIGAARASWARARAAADQMPDDDADRTSMRIAPRTLLCAFGWRTGGASVTDTGFDELRELCSEAGDEMSLLMGMSGVLVGMTLNHRLRELCALAPDYIGLLESTGDPALIMLVNTASHGMLEAGEITEALRLFERAIEVADGNITLGNFFFESPLAWATTLRGLARCSLGHPGWREDLRAGLAMAQQVKGITQAAVTTTAYAVAVMNGALVPDSTALMHTTDAVRTAERCGDDVSLTWAHVAHGIMLVRLPGRNQKAGFELLAKARQQAFGHGDLLTVTMADVQIAECKAHTGELDGAIDLARGVVAHLSDCGGVMFRTPASTVLAESLLRRRTERDLHEAQAAIDDLAACPTEPGFVPKELALLRLQAHLADARGDLGGYRDFARRYSAMAASAAFEGHIAQAKAMA